MDSPDAAAEYDIRVDPRNKLNDLCGRDWIKFTKSWMVLNPPRRDPSVLEHPATYPPELCKPFIEFFTKQGQIVFDPFCGVGNTLVSAQHSGRFAIGFDIEHQYVEESNRRLSQSVHMHVGSAYHYSATGTKQFFENWGRQVDFTMTSPPYWDMLSHARGGSDSARKTRERKGLDTDYPLSPGNLALLPECDEYLDAITDIFRQVYNVTKDGGYLVIVCQNVRTKENKVIPLAWLIATWLMSHTEWSFQGEKIWCQDNKPLGIWGYPVRFVSNTHHHFCLVLQKEKK